MSLEKIKKLRDATSLGISECKKALEESDGDFNEALKVLKKRGIAVTARKDRKTSQGVIEAYVHFSGNLGSLVEINCETDFVAHTDIFKKFAKDIAMHIAAASPRYIKKEDIPAEEIEKIDDIDEYVKNHCLLAQLFIRDNSITVGEYLKQVVSQTGENIVIQRFSCFSLGEDAQN